MNALMKICDGLLFGIGLVLAVALMEVTLHIGLCR